MPVTIEWDNDDKTIVRMEMIGNWTWDEAYAGADQGYAMLDAVPYEVGTIIDFSKGAHLPSNAISHARAMIKRRHPRTGLTVFVGTNAVFRSLWNIFSQVYTLFAHKQNSVFAANLAEARAILHKQYSRTAQ
ncbi:MAG TPA: hypothetical protein VHO69_00100 [Phototrophicaceae bacterium]|nr:hypothetical protein [Phototrophicaceae bacterium]